jgi:hypothetical protein
MGWDNRTSVFRGGKFTPVDEKQSAVQFQANEATIEDVARRAVAEAKERNASVEFEFDGVPHQVCPLTEVQTVLNHHAIVKAGEHSKPWQPQTK